MGVVICSGSEDFQNRMKKPKGGKWFFCCLISLRIQLRWWRDDDDDD